MTVVQYTGTHPAHQLHRALEPKEQHHGLLLLLNIHILQICPKNNSLYRPPSLSQIQVYLDVSGSNVAGSHAILWRIVSIPPAASWYACDGCEGTTCGSEIVQQIA
jgi:hypothetical protein